MEYFTISLELIASDPPNFTVQITITSHNGYKGTVSLGFSSEGDDPLYTDPASSSAYVSGGSTTTTVVVGVAAGDSTTLVVGGEDGDLSAEGNITIDG